MNGKTIRAYRKSRGMTQEEFGECIGYSNGYVSNVERGHFPVTVNMLDALVAAFPDIVEAETEPPSENSGMWFGLALCYLAGAASAGLLWVVLP